MADPNQAARAAASAWDQTAAESTQKLMKLQAEELRKLTEQTLKYGAAVASAVGQKAVSAWRAVTISITGLATAGVASSAMGEMLNFQMERLGRSIAGLLGPEIRALTQKIADFSNALAATSPAQKETLAAWAKMSIAGLTLSRMFGGWIGLLGGVVTGFGQTGEMGNKFSEIGKKIFEIMEKLTPVLENIAEIIITALSVALNVINALLESGTLRWIAGAAAAVLFASIAIKVTTAIWTIVTALKALTLAKIAALAASGPAGWAQLAAIGAISAAAIGGAVMAFNAFGNAAEGGRKKHEALRTEAARKIGGMEALEATWARMAAASVNVGAMSGGAGGQAPTGPLEDRLRAMNASLAKPLNPEQLHKVMTDIAQATKRTADATEQLRPAIGK